MLSSVTATKLKFRKWQWKSTMSTLLQSFPFIYLARRCLFLSQNLRDQVLPRYVLSLAPADPKIRTPVKRSLCLRRLSPLLKNEGFTRYVCSKVLESEFPPSHYIRKMMAWVAMLLWCLRRYKSFTTWMMEVKAQAWKFGVDLEAIFAAWGSGHG
jgi:hypothetical protein